ncbi:MAG: competence/damage-inducible protein A [Bacillota bacterium]|jgi:nicotinamide-nucleotide amidase
MKAEIICIGTELLLGEIVDTNAAYLARELAGMGVDLYHKSTVGDNLKRATDTIQTAIQRADLVLITGGLGPTRDDLTREAIAAAVGEKLVVNQEALRHLIERFERLQRPMAENNKRQAEFPESAEALPNPIGTAPGIWLRMSNGKLKNGSGFAIAAMPGVPREMKLMMEQQVKPRILAMMPPSERKFLRSRDVKLAGIGESATEQLIMPLLENQSNPTIAPYAGNYEVRLRITASAHEEALAIKMLDSMEQKLRDILGSHIYGIDAENLETVIINMLKSRGKTLAVAESCTGGLISHRLTNVPGASAVFMQGAVTYDNSAKIERLGVPKQIIEEHGAVSPETAAAMAVGVAKTSGCDFGLATTGIAGPGGGSEVKPVGLVYVAVYGNGQTKVTERRYASERIYNKEAFAQTALAELWQFLR